MAADKSINLPEELINRMKTEMDNYYDQEGGQIEAVNDNALDDVAGGRYSEKLHDFEGSETLEDGTVITQYFGTDTCSRCRYTLVNTRFYQININNVVAVYCETCVRELQASS